MGPTVTRFTVQPRAHSRRSAHDAARVPHEMRFPGATALATDSAANPLPCVERPGVIGSVGPQVRAAPPAFNVLSAVGRGRMPHSCIDRSGLAVSGTSACQMRDCRLSPFAIAFPPRPPSLGILACTTPRLLAIDS